MYLTLIRSEAELGLGPPVADGPRGASTWLTFLKDALNWPAVWELGSSTELRCSVLLDVGDNAIEYHGMLTATELGFRYDRHVRHDFRQWTTIDCKRLP